MAAQRKSAKQSIRGTPPSWQIVLASACMAFAALEWLLPYLLGHFDRYGLLRAALLLMRSLAWLALLVGIIISFLLFARARPAAIEPVAPLSEETPSLGAGDPPTTMFKSIEQWTLQALRELEWKRFEQLCVKYYEALGFDCTTAPPGPDGGIDITLFKEGAGKPIAVVQCKAWNNAVGVKEIRALLGAMAHEKVARGIFITTGGYTKDALKFGADNPMQLIDGLGFLEKLEQLPKETFAALLKFAFEGDYATPTCASCGIKMIRRESQRGPFWGCNNFPACRNILTPKA